MRRLTTEFYTRENVQAVARDLLGKVLCTRVDGRLVKAIVTETEAYAGVGDRASHAFGGRRTPRTEPMYEDGGVAYVYLCYGIHHLFNVVTSRRGDPQAVLVRTGYPLAGLDDMLARRGRTRVDKRLLAGPGSLARALGIRTEHSGVHLSGRKVWIEDHGIEVAGADITVGPRVGIDYAGEDVSKPYRFRITESAIVR